MAEYDRSRVSLATKYVQEKGNEAWGQLVQSNRGHGTPPAGINLSKTRVIANHFGRTWV